MANLPIVTVEGFSTRAYKGLTIYVEIDILKFVKDKDIENVVVEILDGENYVYLTEIGTTEGVLSFEGLLAVAREWIAHHVKIKEDKQ